jgi:NAD(P)-dependent dehydrogenase (short-subunit alcohol dehydrogenase family)
LKLKDKVVFITDAQSRIGRAIASLFVQEGALLVQNVFPPIPEFSPAPGGMITHADPVSKASIEIAITETLNKYGRINSLIHNNNEVTPAALEGCNDDVFDRCMAVNLKSAFLYVRAAGISMKEKKSGNFVFISSIHDEKPSGGAFAYSLAKGALKMLTKEMALDLGPFNIRTNLISLGPLEGDEKIFYSDISPLYEHVKEKIANNKLGTLADAAHAALFFASDDCQFANGSELKIDGAFLLSYFLRKIYNTETLVQPKAEAKQ